MNHIGMDSHISTLEFAVVNETGRLVKAGRVATSINGFMGFVRTVPRPRIIYIEEGTLAAWALETCVRFGEKLVITDPKKNRWIGSSGQKDDPVDAVKLAQLGRGGYIKEIHHPVGQRRRFRELMIAYHDAVRSTTRIKNKIKAKFRHNGITMLLGLKDYTLGEVWGGGNRVTVKTEVKGREKCPHCSSGRLYSHGESKPREVVHTWSNGRRVYLQLHRRRWKCRDCQHTFTEGRELVRPRSRLTRPAEAEALWQLKDRNFIQVTRMKYTWASMSIASGIRSWYTP